MDPLWVPQLPNSASQRYRPETLSAMRRLSSPSARAVLSWPPTAIVGLAARIPAPLFCDITFLLGGAGSQYGCSQRPQTPDGKGGRRKTAPRPGPRLLSGLALGRPALSHASAPAPRR